MLLHREQVRSRTKFISYTYDANFFTTADGQLIILDTGEVYAKDITNAASRTSSFANEVQNIR